MADLVSLVPNPKNANRHNDQQIQLLAKIMKFQGWRHPIVVSKRSGFIVAGHGRLMAAKLNGWTEAPVDEQDFENEAAEVAFLVSDNTIAELAETDLAKVQDLVLEMPKDFDIDLFGIPNLHIGPMDFPPGTEGDQGQLDEKKKAVCPNCGEEFHP
jgi:hypothetical protein